ncbi:hypothetical protein [Halalkalibacter urbisdiaboli]|uniref:hypothetical protein n=1 Tax=Halalkalibacter urbisdiaboli TaxID=1960589 RepID=UPI001054A07D|nr:hypothetical protein [Halalkalibacter urbisdiaboli]
MRKTIEVRTESVPEAFAALQKGNTELHDELVNEKIIKLSLDCGSGFGTVVHDKGLNKLKRNNKTNI